MSNGQLGLLLNLLPSQKDNNQERLNDTYKLMKWIIDTRANHHMTRNLELLSNVTEVLACQIGLSDGKEATVEKKGAGVLNKHLTLHDVLYVPSLKSNLIVVSQLVTQ